MSWHKPYWGSGTALAATVFLLGLCIAAAAGGWLQRDIEGQAEADFQRSVARVAYEISLRYRQPIYGLNGARGVYAAIDRVKRAQFRDYVESRDLPREFPGVRGFGFIQRVMRTDLDTFIAAERADEAPQFAVRQLGDKDHEDFYIIKFIEPLARNFAALGLDVGSERWRRDGAERAVQTGEPTLTATMTLVQDEYRGPGSLLYVPVFRHGADPTTPAQRRKALVGLLYAPVIAAELLASVSSAETGLVDFELFDSAGGASGEESANQLVFDSLDHFASQATGVSALPRHSRFQATRSVALPGRELTLRVRSARQFDAAISNAQPWLVFAGGVLISAMLALLLRQQASGRRRAEALARSMTADLNRLAQVARHTTNAVLVTDSELRVTWVNEGFTRMYNLVSGYAQEDVLGKTLAELFRMSSTKTAPAVYKTLVDAITRKSSCRVEIPHYTKDGQEYWIDVELQPLHDSGGEFTGYMEIASDISARRKAEAEAQRGAQLLRGAIDVIDEAFVLYDPQDRLVFCNDKYRSIYAASSDLIVPGASFEEIVRKGAERGQYADAVGRVDEWVAERMAAHRGGDTDLVQRLDDGRSLRIVERKMPDGHIVGFRIDITELVRATEAAHEARAMAEAATAAKSQFLANMSHEIRTPMNAILGMLALLGKTELTSRQADYASKTEGAARALMGLLNDILDFSKVEAGKMTLDPHPFSIERMLRELSVIVSANIGPKHIEVLFDIDPALPRHLVGDAMRLQQVLINLSGNAIKFTAEGEVVISMTLVQRDAATVSLRIAVRDTGIGIAPENHARVFSGFTQAEASTTRRFGGTGLGVAISQRLVALMGGALELDSALGEGSCFHFCITLPIAAAAEDEAPAQAAPAAPMRALFVDDNPTARAVLERMGRSLGWSIDVADSGERALALLQSQNVAGIAYQAVFVDWQMPGLDGWETSRRIRELSLDAAAPVVVMVTAHGREMLAQRSAAEQTLLDDFLVKPVTASMLFDAVAHARSGHAHPHASGAAVAAGAQRLAGMRVLVAEDNLNNQQVARELLEYEGAIVRIVNNGQEALEAVAAAGPPFDVVLMDLQMPVMDGYTATSRIREDLGRLTLPIVAMTANAMASDREACLAAGMNDHVGKPFDLNHLVQVLRQHAGWQEASAAPAVAELELPGSVSAAATDAGVDIAIALDRIGGDVELYQRMLRLFVKDLVAMPAQLSAHVAQGEADAAKRLLHTLKGVAATMGATALSGEAAKCEKQLATNSEATEVRATLRQAAAAIAAARPGLAALLQALQTAEAPSESPTTALDADAVLRALRALAEQLRNADMAATDSMIELRRKFGGVLGAQLQPLDEAVGALDFDRALRLCDALIDELGKGQAA